MAWMDARHNFSRLFLFISSIIIGIAALVAINSFRDNLHQDINDRAKDLLGADLVVSSNKTFDANTLAQFDSLVYAQAMDARMASMVLFKSEIEGTRLVQIVAVKGGFPFYGKAETLPENAWYNLDSGTYALLDENLAIQYEVSTGDSVKVGSIMFPVAGVVTNLPGVTGFSSTFAPSVYISFDKLEATGLVQYGSRINYNRYFKTDSDADTEELISTLRPGLRRNGYSYDDVEERKEDMGRGLDNLYRFFNLLGFVALILGCIGVASSVHIYVQEKRPSVAVLRCLGASGWQSFNIFLLQALFLGMIGSFIGAVFGVLIQYLIPWLFSDLIPMEININLSWLSIGEGMLLGLIISGIFSFLPLTGIRSIPPLEVLRTAFEKPKRVSKIRILVIALALLFPLGFAIYQTGRIDVGLSFFAALILTFLALYAVAQLLIILLKRFFPSSWTFIWRQALANLFRPYNQTTVLMVVIGLGAFLVSTLNLVQNSLLNQVEFIGSGSRANTVLFDIQSSQREGIIELTKDHEVEILQMVPIVTMKIETVKGRTVREIQEDTTDNVSNWSITREYRVTYRDSLIDSETLMAGELMPGYDRDNDDSLFVSVSESMAERLGVDLKDAITFDVQGVSIKTYIGSIRDVDWQRIQTNFIFVFPLGVLEEAPQFHVMMAKIRDKEKSTGFQRQLIARFPNVSVIDLTLILKTVDDFMGKVAMVIQFMALFSISTGMVVLAGAVINSKYLRLKENVLLRTLGALRRQIVKMTLIEYAYLGLFAGLTGVILSLLAGWGLTIFFFDVVFFPDLLGLSQIWIGITMLTMLVGWVNTRGIFDRSPLEVLRKEV